MYQLVYISTATRVLSDDEFECLFHGYKKRNKKHLITSMLLYSGSSFLQLLEGQRDAVEKLYENITKSKLNTGCSILFVREVENRSFPHYHLESRRTDLITFESVYCLCLTEPNDALKKMELMTNVKALSAKGFDPERLMLFEKAANTVAKKTDNFYEFATEMAADEVFLMRSDSQIIYVNHSACEKLGYDKDELIGKYVWEWDPLFPKEVWPDFYKNFLEKKHLHFQTQHKKKSGEVFPVEIHAHLFEKTDETFLLAFVSDISAQHRAHKDLVDHKRSLETIINIRTSELNKTITKLQFYKKILDKHSGISITDAFGTIAYVNDLMLKPCGYTRAELLGSNHRILKSGLQDKAFYQLMYKTISQGKIWQGEICNQAKDGSYYWLDITIVPQRDEQNEVTQYFSIRTDITEKKEAQLAIKEREEKLSAILENASDGIHIINPKGKIVECSLSFANGLGYSKEEALALYIWDVDPLVTSEELLDRLGDASFPLLLERKHVHKNGSTIDVEVFLNLIELKGDRLYYCSSRDISKRLQAQKEVELLARTDQLTGLANRHKFMEYFTHLHKVASREEKMLILSYVDLDDFKSINDNHGHAVGDLALKHVSQLLLGACREYDLVSRIGGDEFSVLIFDIDIKRAKAFADKILGLIKQTPLAYEGEIIHIGLSIGLAVFPEHGADIQTLMQKADIALYRAKHDGKGKCIVFE